MNKIKQKFDIFRYFFSYKENLNKDLKERIIYSLNNNIEKVIYINLKDAKDRYENINKLLDSIFDKDKIIRFDAIKNKYWGATESHIGCLELAIKNNWKNVLIIEDDISISDRNIYIDLFNYLISNKYDVIHLGATYAIYNPFNFKLYNSHSGTAYLVNNHYFEKLKNHFKEGLLKLKESYQEIENKINPQYIFDDYWKILQIKDNWKIVYPPLFIQKNNYSYVNQRFMIHERAFFTTNLKVLFDKKIIVKLEKYLLWYMIFNYYIYTIKFNFINIFIILFCFYDIIYLPIKKKLKLKYK